jgi:hypothetical protein
MIWTGLTSGGSVCVQSPRDLGFEYHSQSPDVVATITHDEVDSQVRQAGRHMYLMKP